MPRGAFAAASAAALIACLPCAAFAVHPWLARRPPITPPAAHQLNDVKRWPAEPATPPNIDPARFDAAIDHLCGHVALDGDDAKPNTAKPNAAEPSSTKPTSTKPTSTKPSTTKLESAQPIAAATTGATDTQPIAPSDGGTRETTLGGLLLSAAAEAGVDPFLLAGLMYEQSGCHPNLKAPLGRGLLRIHPSMYRSPGAPTPPGDKSAWTPDALLDPAQNLRLGAKLLRMWQDTHVELDQKFRGVPHRGAVAHFVWGDVVRGSGNEDQAMTARRRTIQFYEHTPDPTAPNPKLGITLICPLEGAPRVASSGPGEDRAGGKRQHQGIDLGAALGEPVRAVADGIVNFAGANVPGAPHESIPPSQIAKYRWRNLGPGGIYVCIEHAPERHVETCYMHLNIYNVAEGDKVTAGEVIGKVGRTGVQVSPPHLHFELRIDDRKVNPIRYLGDLVIPPKATQTYRHVMQAKRMRIAGTHAGG